MNILIFLKDIKLLSIKHITYFDFDSHQDDNAHVPAENRQVQDSQSDNALTKDVIMLLKKISKQGDGKYDAIPSRIIQIKQCSQIKRDEITIPMKPILTRS